MKGAVVVIKDPEVDGESFTDFVGALGVLTGERGKDGEFYYHAYDVRGSGVEEYFCDLDDLDIIDFIEDWEFEYEFDDSHTMHPKLKEVFDKNDWFDEESIKSVLIVLTELLENK